MKLTPLDLEQQAFNRTVRGYDPKQVDTLLGAISTQWEDLLRDLDRMKDEMEKKEASLKEFRDKEKMLKDTLMTAQKIATDLKTSAKKEADLLIGQAELQADKIIHQAHRRLTELIDEINELKRQRADFEGKLTGILEGHRRLLDLHREKREEKQIENLAVLPAAS